MLMLWLVTTEDPAVKRQQQESTKQRASLHPNLWTTPDTSFELGKEGAPKHQTSGTDLTCFYGDNTAAANVSG